jgi:glycosyltransferase involved in cell wall biosynthesis
VKLAVVVQRYGEAINGGAELHARYVAEHLARHANVEVLTTCAADYVTWRNELAPGIGRVNDVPVRRFRVAHERDPLLFGRLSERVFNEPHSIAEELEWLEAEGPTSPALIRYIARHANQYDYFLFFSYRYYHAFHGVRAASRRAVLVPTAERDAAAGVSIFAPIFRGVRALMYNSPEERSMIQALSSNHDVPSVVVGVGSEVPANPQPARFRQKFDIRGPFVIYVGRIDANKGCTELFEYFDEYLRDQRGRLSLVLIGNSLLSIPRHPRIRHLGFLDDTDKFDGMAAADLLVMPSYFESLSMVALEAWALGKPVLANARCDVLKGQCIRSDAGLYYDNRSEFVETLAAIERNRWLAGVLGRNGRQFFRENYDWPVIERKYLDMLDRLRATPAPKAIEPLPGWFARRRADCPPAADVTAALPCGPAVHVEPRAARPMAAAPATVKPSISEAPALQQRPGAVGGPQPRRPSPPPHRRQPYNRSRRGGPPRPGGSRGRR